jgi:hypothetical protein
MKAIIIQGLVKYLYYDIDFQKAYIKRYNEFDIKDYKKSIQAFIGSMVYDGTINYYELDKKYLDIAWLNLSNTIINLDSLYIDYENSINDDSQWIPFKPLSADNI